jgi:hypothetical protein
MNAAFENEAARRSRHGDAPVTEGQKRRLVNSNRLRIYSGIAAAIFASHEWRKCKTRPSCAAPSGPLTKSPEQERRLAKRRYGRFWTVFQQFVRRRPRLSLGLWEAG